MEDIRGVRLRKFKLRKIILGVRMHFRHSHDLTQRQITQKRQQIELYLQWRTNRNS